MYLLKTFLLLTFSIFTINCSAKNTSLEYLDSLLHAHGVQHCDIVMRQVIEETGHLKCTDCSLDKNNPFGFVWKGKYKEFRDFEHAVIYYKTWQDKWYKGGDYYAFLVKIGYATNPKYISNLKSIQWKSSISDQEIRVKKCRE